MVFFCPFMSIPNLFVYGTLMRNCANSHLINTLKSASIQCQNVHVNGYKLITPYQKQSPKMIKTFNQNDLVFGELWNIQNNDEWLRLDVFESVLPQYWQRRLVCVNSNISEKVIVDHAWAYILQEPDSKHKLYYDVIGNKWTKELDNSYRLSRLARMAR